MSVCIQGMQAFKKNEPAEAIKETLKTTLIFTVLPAILKGFSSEIPILKVSHNLLIYERVLILEAG